MANSKALIGAVIVFGFIGGFITLGGLASLQADTPAEVNSTAKPYRFPWFVWTYEVFVLLFAVFAVAVDYRQLQTPLLALVAIANAFVINIISDIIYIPEKLPGSKGTATRGNVTVAGLIIVSIANFLFILATAHFNLTSRTPPPSRGSDNDVKGSVV